MPRKFNPKTGEPKPLSEDDEIMQEAKTRFQACQEWESQARQLFLDDLRFANADSDNGYQWPDNIQAQRDTDDRVMLTINKVRQHNLQIMNDARQNKPSVAIRPTGNGATYQSAQVYEDVVRHIEYISNAQVAYDTATRFQVQCGIGYWRVATDYAGNNSFDQEIFIRRIKNPMSVYLDKDINEADGSDALYCFIFDDLDKKVFDAKYPRFKNVGSVTVLNDGDDWVGKDRVRVSEYFRVVEKKDKLVHMTDPATGGKIIVRASKIPAEIRDEVLDDPDTKTRDLADREVQWFLIVGDKIAERKIWAGKYIPVVRVVGEETVIQGIMDRKGHTRAMKDPQRMYNYWSSSAVEMVALQGKQPYIGPMEAFEGLETYWDTANVDNQAWLPYNGLREDGKEIPRPERQQPPVMATAYINGMKIASDEIQAVSGQYQAELGAPSNERSGVAIQQRQRQGDNATYHYIDHLGIAIRFTGKILIDLIPKVYDTPRIIRIMAEDGTEKDVQIDPQAQQAFIMQKAQQGQAIQSIFNPSVGEYDVRADIGPSYGTKRQEAFNAFTQILAQNKEAFPLIADLMFRAADFPMADEIAERMRRMVPPQALGEGPSPQVQQLQGELQKMQQLLQTMAQQLGEEKTKVMSKDSQKEIDMYKAITDRLDVIQKHIVSPRLATEMIHDLAMQEHAGNQDLGRAQFDLDTAPNETAEQPELEDAE